MSEMEVDGRGEQPVREYSKGAIRRIKMHNFLTYNDVEIEPGPRLNVVMGPNGTGKSSIVCAIAIGLGASPKLLGRADNLAEFVRTGKDEAFVEIDLFEGYVSGGGNNQGRREKVTTIRRELKKGSRGMSKWKINGLAATEKQVQSEVEKFGIQIGNLCTFLPQEKVGEFSAFDDVGLLRETEKAIGGQKLYEAHQKLIEAEQSANEADRRKQNVEEEVATLEERKKQLEPDKARLEKRREHLFQVDLCKTRKLWIQFEDARSDAAEAKNAANQAASNLQKAKDDIAPLERALRDAQSDANKWKSAFQNRASGQTAAVKANDEAKKKFEDATADVESVLESIKNLGSRKAQLRAKVEKARKNVLAKESQIAAFVKAHQQSAGGTQEEDSSGSGEDCSASKTLAYFQKVAAEAKAPFTQTSAQLAEAHSATKRAQAELRAPNARMREAEATLAQLKDVYARRLADLAKTGPGFQCKQLREWLDSQQGSFRMQVYGPCRLEVTVRDETYKGVVEAHVAGWVWHSFVCQNKHDYDALIEVTQDPKYKHVNVLLATPDKETKGDYPRGYVDSTLKPLGALGVLDDLVEGPLPVLQALRAQSSLHNCLYGEQHLEHTLDSANRDATVGDALMPAGSSGYVAFVVKQGRRGRELVRYQGIRSRYQRSDVSTLINRANPKNFLGQASDPEEIAKVEREAQTARDAVAAATDAYQKAHAFQETLNTQIAHLRAAMNKASEDVNKLQKARSAVHTAKRQLATSEKQLADSESEEARDRQRFKRQLADKVDATLKAFAVACKTDKKQCLATVKCAAPHVAKVVCKQRVERCERAKKDAHAQLASLEDRYKDLHRDFLDAKKFALDLKKSAENDSPLKYDDHREQLDELPDTVDEIQAILETEENAAKKIHANDSLMDQYNALIDSLAKAREQLEAMNSDAESRGEALARLRAPWERTLRDALTALKTKFSSYMAALKARGDVELEPGPTFERWGLVIKVAFRDNAPLSKLQAHVQSGGERSVSTIMFLMALQAHMPSPFRVVDEINQGMDEVNERIVFKRIVANSTGPSAPQYFIITPKLLQKLEGIDHPDVKALIVFNGAWNLQNNFPLNDIIASKKRKLAS